ncbi:unnamed protein product [Dovyalis caffra]|uniref:Phosphoinositide phospholipase C n=1 Tax=Dovyalis caffra TaxID=77055 RepID=A0AAV1R9Z9_9ROSI|nr:unnamed protein product [Dovyalis caffra]
MSSAEQNEIGEGEQLQVEDGEIRMPEYRHLLAIRARKPKGALQNWLSKDEKEVRCLSLSEQQLENATRTYGKDIIRDNMAVQNVYTSDLLLIHVAGHAYLNLYTQHNLLRVYPEGTHIDSSNYDPFVGWMHGAQMVAYNMQVAKVLFQLYSLCDNKAGLSIISGSPDVLISGKIHIQFSSCYRVGFKHFLHVKGYKSITKKYLPIAVEGYGKQLWVMQGMFRANGGCGYVKKPDFLLREEVFDPSAQLPVKNILKVKISSGEGWYLDFCHMYSAPDLFVKRSIHIVKVGIAGIQADKAEYNTNIVKNSWVPEWNKEFEFKLTVPELAVLTVEVLEQNISGKSDFGGQTCLPISELRTGIRAVPLHDLRGEKYKNTRLLMKFDLRDANEFSE